MDKIDIVRLNSDLTEVLINESSKVLDGSIL